MQPKTRKTMAVFIHWPKLKAEHTGIARQKNFFPCFVGIVSLIYKRSKLQLLHNAHT